MNVLMSGGVLHHNIRKSSITPYSASLIPSNCRHRSFQHFFQKLRARHSAKLSMCIRCKTRLNNHFQSYTSPHFTEISPTDGLGKGQLAEHSLLSTGLSRALARILKMGGTVCDRGEGHPMVYAPMSLHAPISWTN